MGVLTHALQQTAQIIEVTQDFHGDQIETARESVACRFRYITELDRTNYSEQITTSDAIAWFEPTANIQEGTIIAVDGATWRVDSLVKARRLIGSSIVFLKAYVTRHSLATFS